MNSRIRQAKQEENTENMKPKQATRDSLATQD